MSNNSQRRTERLLIHQFVLREGVDDPARTTLAVPSWQRGVIDAYSACPADPIGRLPFDAYSVRDRFLPSVPTVNRAIDFIPAALAACLAGLVKALIQHDIWMVGARNDQSFLGVQASYTSETFQYPQT